MFKLTLLAVLLSAILTGCGGGGNEAATAAPIPQAAPTATPVVVTPSTPSEVFKGAFVDVAGVSVGYVEGKTKYDVVKNVVLAIMGKPSSDSLYQLMLSDSGLRVVVIGKTEGDASLGTLVKFPDGVANVKLMASGVHIVFD